MILKKVKGNANNQNMTYKKRGERELIYSLMSVFFFTIQVADMELIFLHVVRIDSTI